MDIIDRAQQIEEAEREKSIERAAKKPNWAGLENCLDCKTIIPAARRANVPGVERCVDCQEDRERQINER